MAEIPFIQNIEEVQIQTNLRADNLRADVLYMDAPLRFRIPSIFLLAHGESCRSTHQEMIAIPDRNDAQDELFLNKYNSIISVIIRRITDLLQIPDREVIRQDYISMKVNLTQQNVACQKVDATPTSPFSLADPGVRFLARNLLVTLDGVSVIKDHCYQEDQEGITHEDRFSVKFNWVILGGGVIATLQRELVDVPDSIFIGKNRTLMRRQRKCSLSLGWMVAAMLGGVLLKTLI
jgi:hypothetical protein